jgi:hypothetical protein
MVEYVLPEGAGYGVGKPVTIYLFYPLNIPLQSLVRKLSGSRHLDNSISQNVGIGLFFSGFMICLTAVQARYTGFSPTNSEEFSSASRSVKPGLIASGIVSAWTWAATLVKTFSCIIFSKDDISVP